MVCHFLAFRRVVASAVGIVSTTDVSGRALLPYRLQGLCFLAAWERLANWKKLHTKGQSPNESERDTGSPYAYPEALIQPLNPIESLCEYLPTGGSYSRWLQRRPDCVAVACQWRTWPDEDSTHPSIRTFPERETHYVLRSIDADAGARWREG